MRLGGRLAAAIDVLTDIETRHRPVADALKDWGLSHRFAGAGDRAAIGNIVYDALRRRRSAGWLLDSDTPRGRAIGALVLEAGFDGPSLNTTLDGDRFAPDMLDDAELRNLATRALETAPDEVRADCPDWCVPMLQEAFGDDWVREAANLATRPPLDLRVNTLMSDRDKVLGALKGMDAKPTDLVGTGIRIPPIEGSGRHPNVQVEPAFQKGWFEVQDLGSQMVAALAGARPAMQVLDFCAGAGGKTLEMAAAMENRGQIFAHDSDRHRLAPIFDRVRRASAHNIQVISDRDGLDELEGRIDLVLVDAPCTGAGTWRRRPDAKWRLSERQLNHRVGEQSAILDEVHRFVRPGGRIAYITCSIFRQENQERIEAFRQAHPEFTSVDARTLWQNHIGQDMALARFDDTGVTLTPALTGTDGFYFAALERSR